MMNGNDVLLHLSEITGGSWEAIAEHIRSRTPLTAEDVESTRKKVPTPFITFLDMENGKYPEDFREVARPPFVLYYQGNLELIAKREKCVAIIGSREASPYGLSMARKLSEDLAKNGYTVVSGLAKGVDAAALEAAVPYGKAVGVLGNGLGKYYPTINKELQKRIASQGLLLTEYPYDTPPEAKNFPSRNRIIAFLSSIVVVAEAKPRSGTLLTVAFAIDAGRDVGAVPYRADEESACNRLIQDGAAMILSAEDVMYQIQSPRNGEK